MDACMKKLCLALTTDLDLELYQMDDDLDEVLYFKQRVIALSTTEAEFISVTGFQRSHLVSQLV